MSLKTVCRLCLATDSPMHVVSESQLQDVYEKLTKRTFNSAARPVTACYICYSQLWKCHSMMIKAEKADELLTQILNSRGRLEREILANIDRNAYNLIETLSISPTDSFEVAASECNMIELMEVTVKDELQLYAAVEETEHIVGVNVNQERTENNEKIESIGTNYHTDNIKREKVTNIQDKDNETTPIQSDSQDKTTLRLEHILSQQLELGETSRNIKITANKRQDPKCKSGVGNGSNDYSNITDNKMKKFICGDCGQTFSNKYHLMEHRGFTEKFFECTLCMYKTYHKKNFEKHIKIHSERNLQCTVCQKTFYDKSNLTAHLRIHTGEKPYQCKMCLLRFTHSSAYKKHIKGTADKPFECDTCQFKFSSKHALVIHIRTHTGERPFKCTICQKRFKMKDALNIHIRSHTGEKPFECTICKQKYSLKCSLVNHIFRTHPEEKPFECRTCKQRFKDKDTLKIHSKEHSHNRVNVPKI